MSICYFHEQVHEYTKCHFRVVLITFYRPFPLFYLIYKCFLIEVVVRSLMDDIITFFRDFSLLRLGHKIKIVESYYQGNGFRTVCWRVGKEG